MGRDIAKEPFYATGQRTHFNRCYSFNVRAENCTSGPAYEHAGLEIISPALTNHSFKIRNQVHNINTNTVMFYNARETHQDIFTDGKANFKALVIPLETQSDFFRDENIDPNKILFESPAPISNPKLTGLLQETLFLRELPLNSEVDLDSLLTELLYEIFTSHKLTHSHYLKRASEKGICPNRSIRIKRVFRP